MKVRNFCHGRGGADFINQYKGLNSASVSVHRLETELILQTLI